MIHNSREPSDDNEAIWMLRAAVFGFNGSPGLTHRIIALETHKAATRRLLDKWMMIAALARWMGLIGAFAIVTLAPADISTSIIRALGALKTLASLGAG